jgi:formylglycine-generating enzyme required for sulfatase activity
LDKNGAELKVPVTVIEDLALITMDTDANGYRLPTIVEFEYAGRGGDPEAEDWEYLFPGSNIASEVGWYGSIYGSAEGANTDNTAPKEVALLAPNALGIYDLFGNLWDAVWPKYIAGSCFAGNIGAYVYVTNEASFYSLDGPADITFGFRVACNQ